MYDNRFGAVMIASGVAPAAAMAVSAAATGTAARSRARRRAVWAAGISSENVDAPARENSTGAKLQNHPCDVAYPSSAARVLNTVMP